jgi:linoleoyl-CoA desaturase
MNAPTRFRPQGPFFTELKASVDAHLARTPARPSLLALKSALILSWWVASWVVLVFVVSTWWQAALAAASLGFAMASIGFNVQHDGGHHAASRHRSVNRLFAFGLDLLGGSSWIWHWKHNVFHHTTPNLVGLDVDIDIQPFVRLAPQQALRPWHRFQHLYTWFLYALLAIKWHFVDDFRDVATGHIGTQRFPRPRGFELFAFISGKVLFFTWAFVVPLVFHAWWKVLLGYLVASVMLSLSLAITFQAAHCVEEATFPCSKTPPQVDWAEHQLRTSVDFGPRQWVWTALLGGLNFQTVHHLFPRLSHLELEAVAPVVHEVCARHGVQYRVLPGFGAAIASHFRWLRRMGVQPVA